MFDKPWKGLICMCDPSKLYNFLYLLGYGNRYFFLYLEHCVRDMCELISHFGCPQPPDTSLHCEFIGSELVNRWNVSDVAMAQSRFSFLPTRGRQASLSLPRSTVCVNSLLTGNTQCLKCPLRDLNSVPPGYESSV